MKTFYSLIIALFLVNGATGQTKKPCVPCLPQGITFTTQAQIDNFQTNYPNCTQIEGDVTINGNDISNLNGLGVLTSIGGNLLIGHYSDPVNPVLNNLLGLNGLTYIGLDLSIQHNLTLTSLTGLDNLTSIGDGLSIYHNVALTSLTGLNNVTSIGYSLFISQNFVLPSLTGLEKVNSVGNYLWISNCNALISLMGLVNLTSVGSSLHISNNDALISLTGLDSLNSIGGGLYISYNDSLTNLTGLDNVSAGSISDLTIYYNGSLSTCEVQSICDYLANPNGMILIHDNATGCNSNFEVVSACANVSTNEIINSKSLSMHPNPASSTITVEIPSNGFLSIHNTSGQQLLHQEITEPTTTIDVSGLKNGLYLVKVVGEKGVQVGRFIKQ